MAIRMAMTDLLHRGVVTSLFGLTVYGIFVGVTIHRDTLKRGRGESSLFITNVVRVLMPPFT